MNRTVIALLGGAFALLMVGLIITAIGFPSFYTQQVSSPEASTGTITNNQGAMLALLVLGVPGIIAGMGVSLYGVIWFLNREVNIVQQQPDQGFELLPAGADPQAVQFNFANNAFYIMMGLGIVMVILTIIVLVAFA